MKTVRRGYLPEYEILFKNDIEILKKAAKDVHYLLNNGYKIKMSTKFVQQHYRLTESQRLALARSIASDKDIALRKAKELTKEECTNKEIYIDGFNAIIPMESLVSNSPLLIGMDGAVRDMANLKGSYHIIDKTEPAINLLLNKLDELKISKAHIFLDRPISNSGRLKTLIRTIGEKYNVELDIVLLDAVDKELYYKENVVSGDSIILDNCVSWIPLYKWIVEDYEKENEVWKIKLL